MPSREQIHDATPACPRTIEVHSPVGATFHVDCRRRLAWSDASQTWRCPKHGRVLTGRQAYANMRWPA